MKQKIALVIFIFVIIACKKEKIVHDTNVIDITDMYDATPIKVNLSEIASSIQYIPLETNSNSLMGRLDMDNNSIRFFDKYILVKDKIYPPNDLLLFDISGKFLTKVGGPGRGPGEYENIEDFTILPKDSLIVINAAYDKKLLFYNYEGDFVKEANVNFQTQELFTMHDHLVTVSSFGFREYSGYYNLTIFDKEGKQIKQLLHKPDEELLVKEYGDQKWGSHMNNAYVLDGKQYYYEKGLYNAKDTIWEITKNFKTKPKRVIYFGGEKKPPKEYYKKLDRANLMKTVYTSIQGFIETDNYMFMVSTNVETRKRVTIYRDMKAQENTRLQFDDEIDDGYSFGFYNDIDGGMAFFPEALVSGNQIFKVIYGYKLKEYLLKTSVKDLSEEVRRKRKTLEEMVKNSKMTDNPILMVVTLK